MRLEVTSRYSIDIPDKISVYGGDYSGECNSEDADLISFVSWLHHHYPKLKDIIYHIPNESMKPVQGRVMDKRKGVLEGAPDICIAVSPPIYIEFKRKCKKLSLGSTKQRKHFERQLEVLEALAMAGNRCFVAFGLDAGKNIIKDLAL